MQNFFLPFSIPQSWRSCAENLKHISEIFEAFNIILEKRKVETNLSTVQVTYFSNHFFHPKSRIDGNIITGGDICGMTKRIYHTHSPSGAGPAIKFDAPLIEYSDFFDIVTSKLKLDTTLIHRQAFYNSCPFPLLYILLGH